MSISIHTDEAQPKNEVEVDKAMASPKGKGPDRQPEPDFEVDANSMVTSQFSPRKGSPRS